MRQLVSELRRRNVFRVAIAYVVASWVIAQIADLAADAFAAPDWFMRMLIVVLVLGLPLALFLAWAYELTPDGVVRADELPADAPKDPRAARHLNVLIIGALCLVIAGFVWDKFAGDEDTAVVADVTDKSIAVLPFADFSPDENQGWFADGLTDEILNALARAEDLRVASRTSAFSYRDSDKDMPTIAKELGVAHILEGSVRRAGERLRVTAQLIRAADDVHLWSETFDGSSADSIKIQEQIALKIARALQTAMNPEQLEKMLSAGTSSVDAWEAYLHASVLITSSDPQGWAQALDLYERAIELDPTFVDAYTGLAYLWANHLSPVMTVSLPTSVSDEEARQRFEAAVSGAEKYARSDATRVEYQILKAKMELRLNNVVGLAERLVALRPEQVDAAFELGAALLVAGRYDEAAVALRRGRDAGEEGATSYEIYQMLHRVDVATAFKMAEANMRTGEVTSSEVYQAHRVFLYAGEVQRAAELARLHADLSSDPSSIAMVNIRQACAEGRVADADRIYTRLLAEGPDGGVLDNSWLFLKTLGRDDEALEKALQLDNAKGLFALAGLLNYTSFDPAQTPYLNERLRAQGISRPPAKPIPFACKR